MHFELFSPIIAMLIATTFVACGAAPDAADTGVSQTAAASGERSMTIAEALKAGTDGPATVTGFLFVTQDEVVLAESMLESFPPQPGGVTLPVSGVDPLTYEMDSADQISWTKAAVHVTGTLEEGVLYVDASDT